MERRWAHSAHFELYEDAVPALDELRRQGLKIGLLSNSSRDLERVRRATTGSPPTPCSPRTPTARRSRMTTIFRAMLELLEVDAGDAVMVGDTLEDDIEGALGVGMRAVLLDREGRYPERRAGWRTCARCRPRSGSSLERRPAKMALRRVERLRGPSSTTASERDGYRLARRCASAGRSGRSASAAALYELAAGERTYPYHFHHGMEEWLLVLAGSPTLRGPDGERVLRAGDVVCFPPGPDGAHQVAGPGTVLLLSADSRRGSPRRSSTRTAASSASRPGPIFRTPTPSTTGRASERGPSRRSVNVLDVVPEGDADDPPGYRARMARFGPSIGAEQLGDSVYELDTGQSVCPYHYEYGIEEWLLVLAGTPTLRDPDGEHVLEPGDLVCFPEGPEGPTR